MLTRFVLHVFLDGFSMMLEIVLDFLMGVHQSINLEFALVVYQALPWSDLENVNGYHLIVYR